MLVAVAASLLAAACSSPQETNEEAQRQRPVTVIERTVVERVVVPAEPAEEGAAEPEEPEEPQGTGDAGTGEGAAYHELDDGILSLMVPKAWDEWDFGAASEAGASWSAHTGVPMVSSITASPDLDAWASGPDSVGVYGVASGMLGEYYSTGELVEVGPNDLSASCSRGARWPLDRPDYPGWVQEWTGCGGREGWTMRTAAASAQGGECVVALQIGMTAGTSREAVGHLLRTFTADCGSAREAEATFGVEEEAAEPSVGCGGFTTATGEPSQLGAQQFYDSTATPEQRAALDPDGNGFACDLEILGYSLTEDAAETPGDHDGVCEGLGETDPDCADAMLEALEEQEGTSSPPGGYVTCLDFATQAEAEAALAQSPQEAERLDGDGDGRVCEHLP